MSWPGGFCVVGLGGHARTKLIPAIEAAGQRIAGVVTSQGPASFPGSTVFSTLAAALSALTTDTAIVIASPPSAHRAQALAAVSAGFDVIVEKPAFLTAADAKAVRAAAATTGAVVVEAFMHRHTTPYERLIADWPALRRRVEGITMRFLIPQIPRGTFRDTTDISASTLYDIGCYPISLLTDLGLDTIGLGIADLRFPGRPDREAITLAGRLDGIEVRADIGVADAYANDVRLRLSGGDELTMHPFFFGRAADKHIVTGAGGVLTETVATDVNAFEQMVSVAREIWARDQETRWREMIAVAASLERLARQLSQRRAAPR